MIMVCLNLGAALVLFFLTFLAPVILAFRFDETGARVGAGLQLVCILGCVMLAGEAWIMPLIPICGVFAALIQMAVLAVMNVNN